MCFSKEVSLTTFSLGFVFSIILYFRTKLIDIKIIALFLSYISLMQFVEFLLWMNQNCDELNKTISYVGMALNHLQPVVLASLILYMSKNPNTIGIIILMLVYLSVFIPYSLEYKNIEDLRCSVRWEGNPHIIWNWNRLKNGIYVYPLFLSVIVVLPFLGFASKSIACKIGIYAIISYTISMLVYGRYEAVGSTWCLFSALVPPILVLLNP